MAKKVSSDSKSRRQASVNPRADIGSSPHATEMLIDLAPIDVTSPDNLELKHVAEGATTKEDFLRSEFYASP